MEILHAADMETTGLRFTANGILSAHEQAYH